MSMADAVQTARRLQHGSTSACLLQRKCACGGSTGLTGECQECRRARQLGQRLQAKLRADAAGDECEHEADRVADHVMEMPEVQVERGATAPIAPLVQRRVAASIDVGFRAAPPIVRDVVASPGQPLDATTRGFFEPRFGHDFSQVRVHAGDDADQSARAVRAHAYTVGSNIVFGAGRFPPHTGEGRRLLAHELAHTIQQTASGDRAVQCAPEKDRTENEPSGNLVGCDKQRELVTKALSGAESLASMAIRAFEREYPFTKEISAMRAHFGSLGSAQRATIVERYKQVRSNLPGTTITCAKTGKKVNEGNERVDLCGQAACPGNTITLYPTFGTQACPAAPVLLHEALHNAGACDDIGQGSRSYPPSNSEDNAYSYENFAVALTADEKGPELGKRRPSTPRVKP